MCQLTFINAQSAKLNKLILLNQLLVNSWVHHKDGAGFYTPAGGLWKTRLCPNNTTNLGNCIARYVKGNDPVMAHVRAATATNNKRSVIDANAHPFESAKLVLAHNGTLEFQDAKRMNDEKYKDMIDSEIFMRYLDERYEDGEMDFVKLLNDVMSEFYGKFAFLIYNKWLKTYFIARGETAKLHYYEYEVGGKPSGFIVNTEKDSLLSGVLYASNYSQLSGPGIKYDEKAVKELPESTIFAFNAETQTLDEVGTIKENKKPVQAYSAWRGNYSQGNFSQADNRTTHTPITNSGTNGTYGIGKTDSGITDELSDYVRIMLNFMRDYDLSVFYIDELFLHILGVPLLGAEQTDIETFVLRVIPMLRKKMEQQGGFRNLRKEWRKLKNSQIQLDVILHKKFGIDFPYFFEKDIRKIREARREKNEETAITVSEVVIL